VNYISNRYDQKERSSRKNKNSINIARTMIKWSKTTNGNDWICFVELISNLLPENYWTEKFLHLH
jgi:hypothetical protein